LFFALSAAVSLCHGCTGSGARPETYLKWVAHEVPINEFVVIRWQKRQMPLRVYLTAPPDAIFENPEAIHDSVRDGVLDWSDVAGPGLPSFVFVDDIGEADIPIVWAEEPDGGWYVAHCVSSVDRLQRRFGVSRILITGRWGEGRIADLHDIYNAVLHEMGHGLGLAGHSPDPGDVMYPSVSGRKGQGLSARDRATLTALYKRPNGSHIVGARKRR
jgi:hypothetical protein